MEVLDQKIITNLADVLGDSGVVQDLLDTFVVEGSRQIDQMQPALEDENYEKLSHLGHNLKGSSGNLGAVQLADFCHKLEQAAKNEETELVASLIKQIRISFGATKSALEAVNF
jgi:histidine phosphotransfer protein HptB